MQIVELKVQVEKSQLAALEAQVKALDGKSINIKVNTAGLTALDKATLKSLDSLTKYQNAQNRGAQISSKTAQAEARVAVAKEKTAQAEARLMTQTERTRTERARASTQAQRTITEQAKLQTQMEKTRTAQERAAKSAQAYGKTTQEASRLNRLLGGSVGEVAAKMAAWQVMGTLVSVPIQAMKEALSTMKEVDTQLVDIRKVTDFSKQQMAEIEEQSYKTASAYGVAADQYLSSVAAFARAGYKEQSADLAELSVKTQLVGNTSAEVANQFLLSTDAAYKYNGSIQELQKVLDGANEIDNKYATSIEKIAEGMGIVAPVADQAHVGVDELMASLGTITAVTQRSGSEAARALRALFLNIIGDTKTEIDEGVTWSTEEINSLQGALQKFAPDVVETAKSLNQVIDPMEAIGALAKGFEEGAIKESDLMEIVSDLGGKLRSSQLLAIVKNWDMYESMLDDFKNAAGSADKEVENAMDSWERKSEILKNTWTKFVSDMVNTDMIKGGLDTVTGFVEFLDSGIGQAVVKAGGLALAFSGVSKAIAGIASSGAVMKLVEFFKMLGTFGAAETFGALAASISPLAVALGAIAAVVATPAIVDFFTTDYGEQADKISELTSEYEKLYGAQSEFETLSQKAQSGEGLSSWEQSRLDYLKQYQKELQNTIDLEKETAKSKYQEEYGHKDQSTFDDDYYRNGGRGKKETETIDVVNLREATKAYDELSEAAKSGRKSQAEYQQGIDEILASYQDFYDATKSGLDAGILNESDLTDAQRGLMELYENMQKLRNVPMDELGIAETILQFDQLAEVGDKSVYNLQAFKEALADAGASAADIEGTIAQLQSDENVVLIDVEAENIDETISSLKELGIATEEAGKTKVNVDEFAKLADNIGLSKEQATGLAESMADAGAELVDAEGNAANLEAAFANVGSPIQNLTDQVGELVTALYEINGIDPTVDLNANDNASETIQAVDEEAENYATSNPTATLGANDGASPVIDAAATQARMFGDMRPNSVLSATDNASSVIRRAVGALAGFVSKTITLTANYVTTGKGPGGGGWGSGSAGLHKAKGDPYFSGGTVLLGDEISPDGAPRPELVITPHNGAFIAGSAGPVITTLPAGTKILKYSDTVAAMSGRDLTEIAAFSAGNDRALTAWQNRNNKPAASSGGGASSGSSGSSSGGGSKSGGSSGKSGGASGSSGGSKSGGSTSGGSRSRGSKSKGSKSKGSSSKEDSYLKQLEEELDVLRAQYSFLEASGAATDELTGKSTEIQGKLHEINDRLRETGGSQKDIYSNSADWYEELDKIHKTIQETFEKERGLLESNAELMYENSTEDKERFDTYRKILTNLHQQAQYMRSVGAEQEDINELSIEWWKVQKEIFSIFEDQRDLMDSEVTLMEHQGGKAIDMVAKYRQIQANLHDQAEYMRKIGARQEDINRLSIQWWEIQNKILDVQNDLMSELDAAINYELKQARNARDEELKRIEKQIDALREERDLQKEQLDIEEKRKAVEEARLALENAKNQRTVRYYNAATGQWEWAADANAVKSAEENYRDTKKSYEEDQKDREYDLRIKELEAQRDDVNARYDSLESRWESLSDSFAEPLRDIKDILRDLLATRKLTDEQVALIKGLVGDIGGYTAQILGKLQVTMKQDGSMAAITPTGSTVNVSAQEMADLLSGKTSSISYTTGQDGNKKSEATVTTNNSGQMVVKESTTTTTTTPGGGSSTWKTNGATYVVDGVGKSTSSSSKSSSSSSGSKTVKVNSDGKAPSGLSAGDKVVTAGGTYTITGVNKDGSYKSEKTSNVTTSTYKGKYYDSGGVLSGLGGIKATREDEIVIPPSVAKEMLKPSANRQFQARMAELGFLYGASRSVPASLSGVSGARQSNDHYGDVYQYGNITLSEGQARGMTVYELAQLSKGLRIYS